MSAIRTPTTAPIKSTDMPGQEIPMGAERLITAEVEQGIEATERMLMEVEAPLANRFENLKRNESLHVLLVVLFLGASAILLAYAFAADSVALWLAGAAAFIASFGINRMFTHRSLS